MLAFNAQGCLTVAEFEYDNSPLCIYINRIAAQLQQKNQLLTLFLQWLIFSDQRAVFQD